MCQKRPIKSKRDLLTACARGGDSARARARGVCVRGVCV